jgi:hypothetical protein
LRWSCPNPLEGQKFCMSVIVAQSSGLTAGPTHQQLFVRHKLNPKVFLEKWC